MPGAPLQESPDKNLEDFFGQVANIKVSMPFWAPDRVHMPNRVCLMKRRHGNAHHSHDPAMDRDMLSGPLDTGSATAASDLAGDGAARHTAKCVVGHATASTDLLSIVLTTLSSRHRVLRRRTCWRQSGRARASCRSRTSALRSSPAAPTCAPCATRCRWGSAAVSGIRSMCFVLAASAGCSLAAFGHAHGC